MGVTLSSISGSPGGTTDSTVQGHGEYDSIAAEYKSKLKALDVHSTGLMLSLDSLFATAEQLKFNLQLEVEDSDCNVVQHFERCKGLVLKLLLTTEDMVLHQKAVSTTAINEFVHFVNENIQKQLQPFLDNFESDDFNGLNLDKYVENKRASNSYEENKYCNEVIAKNEQLEKEVMKLTEMKKRFEKIEKTFDEEKENWIKEIEDNESEIDKLNSENTGLKKSVNTKTAEIAELKAEAQKQTLLNQSIENEKRELQTSCQVNDDRIKTLKETVETKNRLIESLKTKNNALNSSNQELDSNMKSLTASKQSLQSEVESLQAEKKVLRDKIKENDEKMSELRDLNKQNKLKDTDIEKLENSVKTLEKTIESLKLDKRKLRVSNQTKDNEISQLNSSLKDTMAERNALKTNEELLQNRVKSLTTQKEATESKKNELMISIREIESKRNGLLADIKSHQMKIESLENELHGQKRKTEEIETSLKKAAENETENKTKIFKLKSENKTLKENHAEDRKFWELEKSKLETELKNSNKQLLDITSNLRNKEEELQKTKSRLERENKQLLERHRSECDKLNADIEKKESYLNEKAKLMEADIQKYKERCKELQDQLYITKNDLDAKISELNKAKQEITSQCRQLEELQNKHTSLQKESEKHLNELKTQLRDSDSEYAKEKDAREKGDLQQRILNKKLRNTEGRLRDTEEELRMIKQKNVIQVQVYVPNRGDLISNIEDNLTALLKREMESDKKALHFVQCARSSDIKPNIPVILLCITVSRIGTDVQNLLQGLSLSPNMAVVIFHHKDIHALPNQGSDRVLTGQELKPLGGIFDMAFLTDKGIYECPMNRNNTINLKNFIDKEG